MNINLPEGLLLPDELERRQMFHQLKKQSSFTAWNRLFELYQAWADVTERSVREADSKGGWRRAESANLLMSVF